MCVLNPVAGFAILAKRQTFYLGKHYTKSGFLFSCLKYIIINTLLTLYQDQSERKRRLGESAQLSELFF